MSNLNFVEKMLDGGTVEWWALEQVAKIRHGKDWKWTDPTPVDDPAL